MIRFVLFACHRHSPPLFSAVIGLLFVFWYVSLLLSLVFFYASMTNVCVCCVCIVCVFFTRLVLEARFSERGPGAAVGRHGEGMMYRSIEQNGLSLCIYVKRESKQVERACPDSPSLGTGPRRTALQQPLAAAAAIANPPYSLFPLDP